MSYILHPDYADIVVIRGRSLLSRMIEKLTGFVSHVGIVTVPFKWPWDSLVTQALTTVQDVSLYETVIGTDGAYLLHAKNLTDDQRLHVAMWARTQLGVAYDYKDIGYQFLDNTFHTEWFTQKYASPKKFICSELVAKAYATIELDFGVPARSATPEEIYVFALNNADKYDITKLM